MKVNQSQKVNDNVNQKNSFSPVKTGDNSFEENLKDLSMVNDLNNIVNAEKVENASKQDVSGNTDVKSKEVQTKETLALKTDKTDLTNEKEIKNNIIDEANMISVSKESKEGLHAKKSEISELEQTLQEFIKKEPIKEEQIQPKAKSEKLVKSELLKEEQVQPKVQVEEFVRPEPVKAEQHQPKNKVEEFVRPEPLKSEQLQPKAEIEEFVKPEPLKSEQLQPKAEIEEFVKSEPLKSEQLQPKAEIEEFVKPEPLKSEQLQPKAQAEEFIKHEHMKVRQIQPKAEVEEFVKPEPIKSEQLQPKVQLEEFVKAEMPKTEYLQAKTPIVDNQNKDENTSVFESLPLLNQLLNIDNDLNIKTPKMEDIIPVEMRKNENESVKQTEVLTNKTHLTEDFSLSKNEKDIVLNPQEELIEKVFEQTNPVTDKNTDNKLKENTIKPEITKNEPIIDDTAKFSEKSFVREHIAVGSEKEQGEKLEEINNFLNEIMAEDTVESLKSQDASTINGNVLINEEIRNYYNLNKAENYSVTEDIKAVINERISAINEISEILDTAQETKVIHQELKTLETPKTTEKKPETKQLTLTEKDAKFFSELVKTSQETGQTVNETVNKILEDVQKSQETTQTATVSKALADMINEAAKTNKPFRIDFDKNISVIIKVDREGRISAEFLPGDKAVEQYLKSQLPLLQQKFDKEQIDYKDLNYRQSNGGKQQQRERRKRGE